MKPLPHQYQVTVSGGADNILTAFSEGLPDIPCEPPKEFDGSGDKWSPESLLMSSLASCLVLSFKAIAKMSDFNWESIECDAIGELDKVERKVKFTKINLRAHLYLQQGADIEKAKKLLEKAEQTCFVSNSLSSEIAFECEVTCKDDIS